MKTRFSIIRTPFAFCCCLAALGLCASQCSLTKTATTTQTQLVRIVPNSSLVDESKETTLKSHKITFSHVKHRKVVIQKVTQDSNHSNLASNTISKLIYCPQSIYSKYLHKNKPMQKTISNYYLTNQKPITDLPIISHAEISNWMIYFQNSGRETYKTWLQRSYQLEGEITEILSLYGLPKDLLYLSMIESGFNNKAFSRVKASGAWQFMAKTGEKYGLKIDTWLDERRDLIKSTHAAARYLTYLYKKFNNWHLALAAYNGGEGRVQRTIRRAKVKNFWYLAKFNYLKGETRNYVPKILAALIISKDPAKYGFRGRPMANTRTKPMIAKLIIPHTISIRHLAKKLNFSYRMLKRLNPELKSSITPPQKGYYTLLVPKSLLSQAEQIVKGIPKPESSKYLVHQIKAGDTIDLLAQLYQATIQTILTANPLIDPIRLHVGQPIKVPIK